MVTDSTLVSLSTLVALAIKTKGLLNLIVTKPVMDKSVIFAVKAESTVNLLSPTLSLVVEFVLFC